MPAGAIHVLHVDDDPDITDLSAAMLEREADFRVTTATDPEDGLTRFDAATFDCVVSDYDMPGIDGLELYDRLAPSFDHVDFPFILFTGRGSESVAAEALNAGVTGYLQKGGAEQYDLLANRIRNATANYRAQVKAERYETVLEALDYPVYVVDERGTFRYVNEPFARVTGYDIADIVGRPTSFVKPDETVRRAEAELGQLLSSTGPTTSRFEATIETADGDHVACCDHMGVLPYEGESFRGSVGILRVLDDGSPVEADGGGETLHSPHASEPLAAEALLHTVSDPVYVVDDDGEFVFVNDRLCAFVGADPADIVGTSAFDITAPEDHETTRAALDRLAADGVEEVSFEKEMIVDGERTPVEGTLRVLSESPPRYVGIVSDSSDRRRATDRYRALFDNLPDPTVVLAFDDGVPRIRRANDAFETVFGYDPEAIVGESVNDLLVPPGRAEGAANIDEAMRQGEYVNREVRRETVDGETRDFLFRNVPITHDNGDVLAYGVYTDITERIAYEESLTALHETARRLMAAASVDELLEIGLESAADGLGHEISAIYRYDEVVGGLAPAAATDEAREVLADLPTVEPGNSIVWRAYESGAPTRTGDVREDADVRHPETPIRSAMVLPLGDQGVFVAWSTAVDEFDETDLSLGRVLTATVQSALQQVEREETLREREQSLARQNERLDEFASIVSHDLRTPLDLAGVHLELALEELATDDEDVLEHFDRVEAAHDRMSTLISDVLTWAREGAAVDSPRPVSVADLATGCWRDLQTEDADLVVSTERTVEGDPDRLRRVFENLFANAVAYAGERPTVEVGDTEDGGVFVADDGPGIPEDARGSVFDSGLTLSEDGNGFGLAIVEQIVHAHGWQICATESGSGGARFEITGLN
ncbi:PAS domain S-box protein [Haloarcula marina]|uniref:PAS domain S-box protein n=1 Tax=Haloarcula marina TaxID=2961574 RepID=UPI0020B87D47|nr:PAS domain S-box protein [Halomicroarcula marina]